MSNIDEASQIDASPTKGFFVDMLVRDIPLEQAVLDLVDNCVDGAKRTPTKGALPFDGRRIDLNITRDSFSIVDNCGGFDRETAKTYAFRFGRARGSKSTTHSIGQFGVGMKRALFKFGRHFVVRSATSVELWAIDVDVDKWEAEEGWHFPWVEFSSNAGLGNKNPGTEIIVDKLRPEVASKFATTQFINSIGGLLKSKHRQFISEGLEIRLNGNRLDATNLFLLVNDELQPGVENITFSEDGASPVSIRIIVGVGPSLPREAGWYVICNGRVVLEADRRKETGWGLIEENANRLAIPSFHNQFARFRGITSFDSDDSARVPWNTTKTDIDQDSPVWRLAFEHMIQMMRPVIDFLNELDADIDEFTRDKSPLLNFVAKAPQQRPESLSTKASFKAPVRGSTVVSERLVKIQYARPIDDVEFLKSSLNVASAKAVGEKTFDLALKRQRGK